MPGPAIADVATWAAITTPPADGDRVAIAAGAGPLRPNALQILADRDRFILTTLNGQLATEPEVYVTTDLANLRVKPFAIVLGERMLTQAAEAVVGCTFPGGSPGWFYLYAYDNAGAMGYEISATAPDAALRFKTGVTTHRYLASVRTEDGAAPTPFHKTGRVTRYPKQFTGGLPILTGGGAPTWLTLQLTSGAVRLLPPHAIMAALEAFMATAGTGELRRVAGDMYSINITTAAQEKHWVQTSAGPTQSIVYGVAAGTMTIRVEGWQE